MLLMNYSYQICHLYSRQCCIWGEEAILEVKMFDFWFTWRVQVKAPAFTFLGAQEGFLLEWCMYTCWHLRLREPRSTFNVGLHTYTSPHVHFEESRRVISWQITCVVGEKSTWVMAVMLPYGWYFHRYSLCGIKQFRHPRSFSSLSPLHFLSGYCCSRILKHTLILSRTTGWWVNIIMVFLVWSLDVPICGMP